uniref:ADP/ATP translocase n=1 Tax=Brassica oleracea var. oleracea TaxID=109376 RepID=A0A0D3CL39_BRAOL
MATGTTRRVRWGGGSAVADSETIDAMEQINKGRIEMADGFKLLDLCLSQQEQWMAVDSYGIWLTGCISLSRQIDGWNGGEESPQAWTFADDGNLSCGDCNRSVAGATISLFLYHLDHARARLGTDAKECSVSGKRHIKGMVDVYRKTLSSDGVKGFYRGFGVSILGITLYRGMYFGMYDTIKPIVSTLGITLYRGMYFGMYDTIKPIVLAVSLEGNFLASFLLGWSITTFVGVIAYPFDTVRRRMMLTSGQPVKYMNAIHALREIMKYEGFSALYKGVTANVLLSVAGAGVLAGYDHLHRIAYKHWLQ